MCAVGPLIAGKRQSDAMEGEGMAPAECFKLAVSRPARAHVVLGMHFKPQASRRIVERLGVMLGLEAQSGGWRVRHGYIFFGVREPMPFGVLMVVQVPAFTSDQALP